MTVDRNKIIEGLREMQSECSTLCGECPFLDICETMYGGETPVHWNLEELEDNHE